MDIETLRRANEALSLMEDAQERIDSERSIVEKATRRIEILEARIAGCKQTLMECGVAVPVSRIIRCEPPRTLESEGQKWDEEARAKSGQVSLTTEQLGRIWASGRDQKIVDEATPRQATVDVPRSMGMSGFLTSDEFYKALWAHHDSLKKSDGSCPSSEHHGC